MAERLGGRLRRIFADALFPAKCFVCGVFLPPTVSARQAGIDASGLATDLGDAYMQLLDGFLCRTCRMDFQPLRTPLCSCCGVMFPGREGEDHLCGRCLEGRRFFSKARAAGSYQGSLMHLIRSLKYQGKVQLGTVLGALLLVVFERHWDPAAVDMVTAVPLHARRLRKRGFNQSAQLVGGWARLSAKLSLPAPILATDRVLVRSRATAPQTGLPRARRLANLKNAFAVVCKARVRGKYILLVDDVLTTGATAGECARVLMAAGARRVDVLTLARA